MKVNVIVTCTVFFIMLMIVNPLVSMGDTYKTPRGSKEIIAMIVKKSQQPQLENAITGLRQASSTVELDAAWSGQVPTPRDGYAAERQRHNIPTPSPKKKSCHTLSTPSPIKKRVASLASLSECGRSDFENSDSASLSECGRSDFENSDSASLSECGRSDSENSDSASLSECGRCDSENSDFDVSFSDPRFARINSLVEVRSPLLSLPCNRQTSSFERR